MLKLSKTQARHFLLIHQELSNPRQLENDQDILSFIEKIGCIQYDPLNKVGRNADLVLQSRCKNYSEQILFDLLYKKRALIDAWDKNMSIMSVRDWPYFTRSRKFYKKRYKKRAEEFDPVREEITQKLKTDGHLNSGHINQSHKVDWGWTPTQVSRAVLESMYHYGELIIHHKEGTRKYYDFANKHLPASLLNKPDPNKKENDYIDWYVSRRIGAIGLIWNKAGDAWLGINDLKKDKRSASIKRLLKKGLLTEIKIEGVEDFFYSRKQDLHHIDNTAVHNNASIIAPLDNLIWDRKMVSKLFDFEYKWEVYTPVSKRKFGYYVLPIIYSDRFIARFEPVIDRENKTLIITNWWWEDNIDIDSKMTNALISCFSDFMKFTSVKKISVQNSTNNNKLTWIKTCK